MPMLLEDLVEETTASNRRLADRLAAEAWELAELRDRQTAAIELRQRAVESARQATDYVLARLPETEGVWRLAMLALRQLPPHESAERLLNALLRVCETGQKLTQRSRTLWTMAQQLGADTEQLAELETAERWFEKLAAETKLAQTHRTQGWQPADPERLAEGLRLAREGKIVSADAARSRFRQPQK